MNVEAADTYPTVAEIQAAIAGSFTTEDPQGFMAAPEFFQSLAATDHDEVALAMEAHCADPRFYWVALIDASQATVDSDSVGAYVTAARAEKASLVSPLGHSWYYGSYLIDFSDNEVPASMAVAGVAIRRMRTDGFREPPAGVRFPVYGVKGVAGIRVDDKVQAQLNPEGINVIRDLPNWGVVVWAARTVSPDPYYRHSTARVILNILAGTLRDAYDTIIFSTVDGQGVLYSRIKGSAVTVLETMRRSGALYGAKPQDAYRVICGPENNPGATLDAGQVNLDIYVKVSPTLEFLGIRLNKTSLATEWSDIDDIILQS